MQRWKSWFLVPSASEEANFWEHVLLCLFSFFGALMLFGTQALLHR